MREDFLHFAWQHLHFNTVNLRLTNGDSLTLLKVGEHNLNSGPDFGQSRIKINGLEWMGNTEIHIKSSDWNVHKHQYDPAYNGVVLHVVYDYDLDIFREDGTLVPTLELKSILDLELLDHYETFLMSYDEIICSRHWNEVPIVIKVNAIEKALVERLEMKSKVVQDLYDDSRGDWDEISFRLLGQNFGFKINKHPFQLLVESVPLNIVRKLESLDRVEALLFGQAGFLTGKSIDAYHAKLKNEYLFLKRKFNLKSNVLKESVWKFGKLRPPNFPTIRIAQLAAIVNNNHLFELLTQGSLLELKQKLKISASDYWQHHYKFGVETNRKYPGMGNASLDILIVNTTIPLLIAYSKIHQKEEMVEQALGYLQMIKPESNRVVRKWEALGYVCESSADSQGVLELFQSYCAKKKCLNCNIGTSILNKTASNG